MVNQLFLLRIRIHGLILSLVMHCIKVYNTYDQQLIANASVMYAVLKLMYGDVIERYIPLTL